MVVHVIPIEQKSAIAGFRDKAIPLFLVNGTVGSDEHVDEKPK
jgi:hypothetical protein